MRHDMKEAAEMEILRYWGSDNEIQFPWPDYIFGDEK